MGNFQVVIPMPCVSRNASTILSKSRNASTIHSKSINSPTVLSKSRNKSRNAPSKLKNISSKKISKVSKKSRNISTICGKSPNETTELNKTGKVIVIDLTGEVTKMEVIEVIDLTGVAEEAEEAVEAVEDEEMLLGWWSRDRDLNWEKSWGRIVQGNTPFYRI